MLDDLIKGLIELSKKLGNDPALALTVFIISYLLTTLANAIGSVFIEDTWKSLWRKTQTFVKYRSLSRYARAISGKNLYIADVFDDIYLADVNLSGYSRNNCYGNVSNIRGIKGMCPEYADKLNEKIDFYMAELKNRRMFPELKMALQDYYIQRGRSHLDSGFVFDFEPRTYAEQLAATDVFLSLDNNTRAQILNDSDGKVAKQFSNTFGVSVVIITGDKKLLVGKRSNYVRRNKNKLVFGVVEGTMESDIELREQKVYPHLTAIRGLETEVGLRLHIEDESAMKAIALILNQQYYEWNMIFMCDCRKMKKPMLAREFADIFYFGMAYDKFEYERIEFVDFDIKSVIKYLNENKQSVVNYSRAGCLLALYDEYGERAVNEFLY